MTDASGIAPAPALAPIVKTITVRRPPAEAFELFTAGLARWWPFDRYSLHQAETATCAMEPRAGGRIWETARNGEEATWGTVLAWEPPSRFVMAWHPGRPAEAAQEVELTFEPVPEGTRVTLEHRDWAKLGAEAVEMRGNYLNGWAYVFDVRYAEACA
jgi:uncharacterized protein YndB with AHSA1/START domain